MTMKQRVKIVLMICMAFSLSMALWDISSPPVRFFFGCLTISIGMILGIFYSDWSENDED
jgi:hypothetical protein